MVVLVLIGLEGMCLVVFGVLVVDLCVELV